MPCLQLAGAYFWKSPSWSLDIRQVISQVVIRNDERDFQPAYCHLEGIEDAC